MERPRFRPYIVPEAPGSMEEIILHTSYYVEGTRVAKQYLSRIKGLIAQGTMPQELGLAVEDRINQADQLDFQEQIPQDEKERIFNPAIEAMKSFATQHGIALPDNLIQRITILNDKTTSYIYQAFHPEHEDDIGGSFTIGDKRLSFINNDVITQICAVEGVKKEDLMREMGIHELWHSAEYAEVWLPDNSPSSELEPLVRSSVKRAGIYISGPEKIRGNYSRLQEGFTQYLTRETLRLLNELLPPVIAYKEELEIIDILIGRTGPDPFIQATFSKKGFRTLFNALEQRFGKGAFIKIGEALQKDWEKFLLKSLEGDIPSSRYPITKKVLQESLAN